MTTETQQRQTGEVFSNAAYLGFSALQIRLDCNEIYQKIENFLRGYVPTIKLDDDGNPYQAFEKEGDPKCNSLGVQSILSKITSMVNTQVVQGNLKEGRYEMLVAEYRVSFTEDLILNCYEWEIGDNDLNFIIDFVIDEIELFLTRLIDNEERKSYAQTIKTAEQNILKESGGGLKLFK